MQNKKLAQRLFLGSALGIGAGVLCFTGFIANPDMPAELIKYQTWSLSNIMMWVTIANRFAVGVAVALAGIMTKHPIFGFKIPSFIRGAKIGLIISLSYALGALMGPDLEAAKLAFWYTFIAGGIIGGLIDLIITKIAGQGNQLTK